MGVLLSSEATLEALIVEAQADPSNDSRAMTALLGRFESLAQRIGSRAAFTPSTRDDAINGARWGLVLAVRAHTTGTAGFPNFAKTYMRGESLRRAWAVTDAQATPTDDLRILDPVSEEDGMSATNIELSLAATIALLTPSQREIVVRRYIDDEPLTTIASDLGVTISAVSQRLGTIHKRLRAAMRSPGRRAA